MDIVLSKAKLYLLVAAVSAVVMGGGFGTYVYKEKKKTEEAHQQELRKISAAKKDYLTLTSSVEKKLSFSLSDYKKVESEFSNLNLLGWQPVEFTCQSLACEYTLNTDNKHYVGIPNVAMGYQGLNTLMSGDNLMIKGINLVKVERVFDEAAYESLPLCTDSLSDMRKFSDIADFSVGNQGGANASTFTFQQPAALVKSKNLLDKAGANYLDIYGINWNAQGFDRMKISYLSRYILNRKNVGISAMRKRYGKNNLGYSVTGTIYCKAN